MMPPGVTSSRLLCLLDLSWWLSRAWYVALGGVLGDREPAMATARDHQIAANKTVAIVEGWLAKLLSPPMPACVAVALDSMGPTWRHRKTEALPEERRYKAGRPERPAAYYRAANTVLRIVELHAIPILCAEGFEADDCIAAAVKRSVRWQNPETDEPTRPLGLDVVVISADKDFGQLLRTMALARCSWCNGTSWSSAGVLCHVCGGGGKRTVGGSVWQWVWGGCAGIEDVRTWQTIEAKYGVLPSIMADWLAIVGDDSDNVRGADGIGDKWATKILQEQARIFAGSGVAPLDGCFALQIEGASDEALDLARLELRRINKMKANPLDDQSAIRIEALRATTEAKIEAIKDRRGLARAVAKLQAQREQVTLARELVTLDTSAPIVWRPEQLPVGGFDVQGLRELYRDLEFYGLAAEVRTQPKRNIHEIIGGT